MPKKNQGKRPVGRKLPPLPADPVGQRFLHYFNHPWNFIFAPTPAAGERPDWVTENAYPLEPRNLWQQFLNPRLLLGLRFGQRTRYIVLDLDRGSAYHPANDLIAYRSLLVSLEEIGLVRPVVCTSSSSGGLHIYFFFESELPSFDLAKCIWLTLTDAGFQVRSGQIELFPNAKAYKKDAPSNYNAHRLPLQAGSDLLDADLEPVSNDIGHFLDAADNSAAGQDLAELEQAIALAKKRKGDYRPGASNRAEAWKQDLEQRIGEGWTGSGQTNALLKDFACYGRVWLALEGEALSDYVVATAQAAPGYQQWCDHQHEIRRRAAEWSRCCLGFYVPYCGYPNRQSPYKEQFGGTDNANNNIVAFQRFDPNAERHQKTFERIRLVVAHLKAAGMLPATATARSSAIIATSKELHGIGVSHSTLRQPDYLPLWHPKSERAGVIACQPPVSAVVLGQESPIDPDPWLEVESPEPAPVQADARNYTLPPHMKVLCLPQASAVPQSTADAKVLNQGGVGGNPQAQVLGPTALSSTSDLGRITRLRVQVGLKVQLYAKEMVQPTNSQAIRERNKALEVFKYRLYLESGEPMLLAEAQEWATANFGTLPAALLPDERGEPTSGPAAQVSTPVTTPDALLPAMKAATPSDEAAPPTLTAEPPTAAEPIARVTTPAVVPSSSAPGPADELQVDPTLTTTWAPPSMAEPLSDPPVANVPSPTVSQSNGATQDQIIPTAPEANLEEARAPDLTVPVTEIDAAKAPTLAGPETLASNPEPERVPQVADRLAAATDLSAGLPPSAAPGATALAPTPPPTTKPPVPWYAEHIKPREEFAAPFSKGQRVKYEGEEYRITVPGHPRSMLSGMKFSVSNDWIEPLESNG